MLALTRQLLGKTTPSLVPERVLLPLAHYEMDCKLIELIANSMHTERVRRPGSSQRFESSSCKWMSRKTSQR